MSIAACLSNRYELRRRFTTARNGIARLNDKALFDIIMDCRQVYNNLDKVRVICGTPDCFTYVFKVKCPRASHPFKKNIVSIPVVKHSLIS